jgi:flagellar P-ring protein precursor FlgI
MKLATNIARLTIMVAAMLVSFANADETVHTALLRDIANIEGVRDNPVFGYGLVVGLKGTGDRQQTIFTIQTLANVLQRMGVQIPPATVVVKNVAAVFVTATLPPFATPGTRLDVTVSSAGDARSLEGGMLLLTPLYAADGQVYAAAQGPLTLGGYSAGTGGNVKEMNHPTVGRIPEGGLVERDSSFDLRKLDVLTVLLSEPNFSTAEQVATAINAQVHDVTATVRDSRRIEVTRDPQEGDVPGLLARIENLSVEIRRRARVVVNERTGTIVMGRDVRLGAVSILHGSFSIQVATQLAVSQPEALSKGETKVVPETTLKAEESASRRIELNEGASVDQLVNGLQKIGATSRDVIAILQAIKAAGALDADLEVI